ncbi:MAG TPA: hypothetical protein VKS79_20355 [Gemmataceae bacterium]|nr:hypothetical protein [Gemmataceae bacterium]
MMEDYSPHQQKIIKRYYENFDAIQVQKLSELVTELYLAEGKKRQRLWKNASGILTKLKLPATRIQLIVEKDDPALLAKLLTEMQGK